MIKKLCRHRAAGILAAGMLLFLVLSAASADSAASVWVNGVELKAGANYLANGSSVASAVKPPAGGYAHFEETTGTLTLYDAIVDTLSVNPQFVTVADLIAARGDLQIVLSGESSLRYTGDPASYNTLYGVYVDGALSIGGTGKLNVSVAYTGTNTMPVFGIYCVGNLTVLSGEYEIFAESAFSAFGIQTKDAMLVQGGNIQIETRGGGSYAIHALNDIFRITGGTINASVRSAVNTAIGLAAKVFALEGGTTSFSVSGPGGLVTGGLFSDNALSFTGGAHSFSSDAAGLMLFGTGTVSYTLTGGMVYASVNADGSDKRVWTSDAHGVLAKPYPELSVYRYVEFTGRPGDIAVSPRTGDGTKPWLWAVIAAACVLLAGGGVWLLRRRKR